MVTFETIVGVAEDVNVVGPSLNASIKFFGTGVIVEVLFTKFRSVSFPEIVAVFS